MKPQLDEIKEALSKATPGRDYEFGSRDKITANAPQWLALLLEENERLKWKIDAQERVQSFGDDHYRDKVQPIKHLWPLDNCPSIGQIVDLFQQLREELEHVKAAHDRWQSRSCAANERRDEIAAELEQVKKERDELQEEVGDLKDANDRLLDHELSSLRSELAAKDKVLEYVAMRIGQWDADGVNPDVYELLDVVRQTLQQVKGDT